LARHVGTFACHDIFGRSRTAILDDNGGHGSANRDDDGRDADNRDSSGDNYSANRDTGEYDYNGATAPPPKPLRTAISSPVS
jgi:hypothetical protein